MLLSRLGDSALTVSFGDEVDDAVLGRVQAFRDQLVSEAWPGVVDVVPAFNVVTVVYDVVRTGEFDRFETRLRELAEKAEKQGGRGEAVRTHEIPVCYGGEYGPDLEQVAASARMSLDRVIELHRAATYRVHAIGFVPGFAYLGGLPSPLHTPRRATPRPRVPSGSVGIGGGQTGVYPVEIPGGWNLIGRTPLVMFSLGRSVPALLHAGDRVTFKPITPEEFAAWK